MRLYSSLSLVLSATAVCWLPSSFGLSAPSCPSSVLPQPSYPDVSLCLTKVVWRRLVLYGIAVCDMVLFGIVSCFSPDSQLPSRLNSFLHLLLTSSFPTMFLLHSTDRRFCYCRDRYLLTLAQSTFVLHVLAQETSQDSWAVFCMLYGCNWIHWIMIMAKRLLMLECTSATFTFLLWLAILLQEQRKVHFGATLEKPPKRAVKQCCTVKIHHNLL